MENITVDLGTNVSNMLKYFKVGDIIEGYCSGLFGRDDYEEKICVLVRPDYAVFEYVDGTGATVLNFDEEYSQLYDKWKV